MTNEGSYLQIQNLALSTSYADDENAQDDQDGTRERGLGRALT
jgi:hypothetical protein